MLVKLQPDQISRYWNTIKYHIEAALPPTVGETPDKMNNILRSLMAGGMQCWASMHEEEVNAILTTTVNEDQNSETKSLLVYSISAIQQTVADSWIDGIETLRKFAKARGCSRVIAYSNDLKIIKICEKLGADQTYVFISFKL